MEPLDVEDGFDVHAHRTDLKLLKQERGRTSLENRGGRACPACDREFDRLLVSEDPQVSFSSAPNGPICLVRTDDQLLVLTH